MISSGEFHFLLVVAEWMRYAWKNWVPQKKNMQLSIIIFKNKSIIIIFTSWEISQGKEHSQLINVLFSSYHFTTVGLWIGIAHLRSPWIATGCHWWSTENQLNPLSIILLCMEESAERSLTPMTLGMWIVYSQHLQWQINKKISKETEIWSTARHTMS